MAPNAQGRRTSRRNVLFILHTTPLPVVARISAIWSKQKLFVSLFFLALSIWFYVDGAIRYPKSNERWDAYKPYRDSNNFEEWKALAKSKGWVLEPPHKHYNNGDIIGQFVFGGLGTIAGIFLLTYWFTQRRRVLKMDEDAVYTPSGARVPFASIRGLGKKRWDSKGIAVVRYEDNGRLLQFIVDDYKYETAPTREIVNVIEEKLTAPVDSPV